MNVVSAAYGGFTAMLGTWWLGRRVHRVGELARANPEHGQMALYVGGLQRLVVVSVLLAIGLVAFELRPLPLVAAFAAAQFGFLVNIGGTAPR